MLAIDRLFRELAPTSYKLNPSRIRILSGIPRMRTAFAPIFIVLVAALATSPARDGSFIYDDVFYVGGNAAVTGEASPWVTPLGEPSQGLWRPLTVATFAAQWGRSHDPEAFLTFNIVLHLAVSLLVYSLAQRLGWGDFGALASGLLFAAHPVHAEVVGWVSGRAELLAALFAAGAWIGHLSDRRSAGWISAFLLLAACLSKENALAIPAVFVLGDLLVKRRPLPKKRYVGFALVIIAVTIARAQVLGPHFIPADPPLGDIALLDRPAIATGILGLATRLLVWPHPLRMHYHRDQFLSLEGERLAIVIAFFFLLLLLRRQNRGAAVVLALVPVAMLTVLNLVPIGAAFAERFLYLPSIPFCLGVGALLGQRAKKERAAGRGLGASLAILLILLGTAIPASRSAIFVLRDDLTLWAHAADVAPRDAHSRYNHGRWLFEANQFLSKGQGHPSATDELWASLHLDPGHLYAGFAHQMLGQAAMEALDRPLPDLELAAYHFKEATRRLTTPDATFNLAAIALAAPGIVSAREAQQRLRALGEGQELNDVEQATRQHLMNQLAEVSQDTGTSSADGS